MTTKKLVGAENIYPMQTMHRNKIRTMVMGFKVKEQEKAWGKWDAIFYEIYHRRNE